jgi:hypothetical protein
MAARVATWLSSPAAAIGRIAAPSPWSPPSPAQAVAGTVRKQSRPASSRPRSRVSSPSTSARIEAAVSKRLGNLADYEAVASDVGFLAGIGVPRF